VAAGLAPIGSGSDGGGSIRIPAGYTGLVGLKTSFRRIPFGPLPQMEPLTSTVGCLSRSVRDSARWLDVCNGPDGYDPFALPRVEGFEAGLGTLPLEGLRVVVAPDLGGTAVVHPQVRAVVEEAAEVLVKAAGLKQVDVDLHLPMLDQRWAIPAMPVLFAGLAPFWPDIRPMLTDEVAAMMDVAAAYDVGLAGLVEPFRLSVIEAWGRVFEQADLVICATNPDDAFPAEGPSPTRVGDVEVEGWNAGRLTMGANLASLPAISVPAGVSAAGLPVGLQIYAPRHRDDLLLDLALVMERERPWPLVAPGAGR
jgi:aspartyl-tRNA(Asn)/glutamyl-tRNA(Gln) amidotransferase subunit A